MLSRFRLVLPSLCAAFLLTPALLPLSALAAPPAVAPVEVSYPSGSETVKGLLYLPPESGRASGRHPAVIVIHEWWGLNDWVKQQAADLAAHGYVALAVDLYRGQVAADPDTAHQLSRGLPQDRGVRDLKAADDFLHADTHVNGERVGVVGWCMGGGYALNFAVADPRLKAVVANYGPPPTDPASLRQIKAAILGNYGGLDKGISAASVESFAATLKTQGTPADIKLYPEAGHAFENPNNTAGYRAGDAADAHARTMRFFVQQLGGRP